MKISNPNYINYKLLQFYLYFRYNYSYIYQISTFPLPNIANIANYYAIISHSCILFRSILILFHITLITFHSLLYLFINSGAFLTVLYLKIS
jgi:hypothetical protein